MEKPLSCLARHLNNKCGVDMEIKVAANQMEQAEIFQKHHTMSCKFKIQRCFWHFENWSRVPLNWEFLIGQCLKLEILNQSRYQIGKFDIPLNSILIWSLHRGYQAGVYMPLKALSLIFIYLFQHHGI